MSPATGLYPQPPDDLRRRPPAASLWTTPATGLAESRPYLSRWFEPGMSVHASPEPTSMIDGSYGARAHGSIH
ncbi:hypothetical protein FMEAI12_5940005 [Parafrankia sp. Ea1.12]|nr:hypothetical protein FMEAI12_5940005 [Parafrankia sp. Ea1.12]